MERNTETVCIVRLLLKHTDSGHWHGAQPPSPPPYTSCLWPSKLSFTGVTVSQGPDIHMSHTMPGVTIYYFDWVLQGVFSLGLPLKCLSTEKLILASLGVSRRIYVNVDSPNLGFPYSNFLRGYQWRNHPVQRYYLIYYVRKGVVEGWKSVWIREWQLLDARQDVPPPSSHTVPHFHPILFPYHFNPILFPYHHHPILFPYPSALCTLNTLHFSSFYFPHLCKS